MGRILYLEHRGLSARTKKPAIGGHTSHISVTGEKSRLDGGGRSPDRTRLTHLNPVNSHFYGNLQRRIPDSDHLEGAISRFPKLSQGL